MMTTKPNERMSKMIKAWLSGFQADMTETAEMSCGALYAAETEPRKKSVRLHSAPLSKGKQEQTLLLLGVSLFTALHLCMRFFLPPSIKREENRVLQWLLVCTHVLLLCGEIG